MSFPDMASNDPDFGRKAADIIGLCLNLPQHAAVLCLHRKIRIQVLERSDPVPPMSPGRAERYRFEYHRHGKSLYAALELKSGKVHGKTPAHHTIDESLSLLRQVVEKCRGKQEIHIILDNFSAQKRRRRSRHL